MMHAKASKMCFFSSGRILGLLPDINIQISSQIGQNYETYFRCCTFALNPEKKYNNIPDYIWK